MFETLSSLVPAGSAVSPVTMYSRDEIYAWLNSECSSARPASSGPPDLSLLF